MKILELTKYFVDRYKLPKKPGYEDGYMDENEEIATYRTAIRRILKKQKIHGEELWDTIKPEKGDREISLDDFMKFCFPEWEKYLLNNYKNDLEKNDTLQYLIEDENNYLKLNEWRIKAEERTSRLNEYIENFDYAKFEEYERHGIVEYHEGSENVLDMALRFQVQALFELFFEEINLKKLAEDLTNEANIDFSYNAVFTEEEEKSLERLESYTNYTKRKNIKIIPT